MNRHPTTPETPVHPSTFLLNETHGLVFPVVLGDEFVIGRSADAEIRVNHPSIARRHTLVRVKQTTVEISDVLSTGGTKVGGVKIESAERPRGVALEMQTGAVRWQFFALKDLASLTEQHRRMALEAAMAHELAWSHRDIQRHLSNTPTRQVLQNLLFAADSEGDRRFARWTEEGFVDVDAAPVAIAPDAVFRVAHPVELSATERLEWQHSLADFELVQSFDQFAREVYTVDAPPTVVFEEQDREPFFAHGWQVRFGKSMYVSCRFPNHGITAGGAIDPGQPVTLWFRGDVDAIPPVVYAEAYRSLLHIHAASDG